MSDRGESMGFGASKIFEVSLVRVRELDGNIASHAWVMGSTPNAKTPRTDALEYLVATQIGELEFSE